MNEKQIKRCKQAKDLMLKTMIKAQKIGCSINVNPKNGKMGWRLTSL